MLLTATDKFINHKIIDHSDILTMNQTHVIHKLLSQFLFFIAEAKYLMLKMKKGKIYSLWRFWTILSRFQDRVAQLKGELVIPAAIHKSKKEKKENISLPPLQCILATCSCGGATFPPEMPTPDNETITNTRLSNLQKACPPMTT